MNSGPSGEEQVRETERARLRALVTGDLDMATGLHADDFQLNNPAGGSLSKDAYLGMIASGELRYRIWEPDEIAVNLHGEHAAAIRYQSVIDGEWAGQSFRGRYWHTDTYERRAGQWQVVWSQATEMSDP